MSSQFSLRRTRRLRSRTAPLFARSALAAAVLVAFSASSSPRTAQAYNFPSSCWSPNKKDSGPLHETRNVCSIPNGSAAASGYADIIARWNENSNLAVTASFVNSSCSIDLSDWNNEIGRVARSQIDGANGLTTFAHVNVCVSPPGSGNWGATDVRLASDLNFSTRAPSDAYPNDALAVGGGRMTLLHEIGHQLGLGHDRQFNVLTDLSPRPGSPIGPVPYPDDVAGVAVLYGDKANTNLFASGQRWSSSAVVSNHEIGETVCMGSPFVANVTVVNPGTTGATYNQQVLLDDNVDGSSPAATFTWVDATTARRAWTTFPFSISTLGVTPGSYFVLHKVDSGGHVAESREDDNILVYTGKVQVADCSNVLTIHSVTSVLR